MIFVFLFLVGAGFFAAGMGLEAFLSGAHTDALEHEIFVQEIEIERLKEGRP